MGKFLAEWIEKRGGGNQGIDDLAEASANIDVEKENPFLFAIFSGLGGNYVNKKLASNIYEDFLKNADPR